jgi:two-component sensor histidine kinase
LLWGSEYPDDDALGSGKKVAKQADPDLARARDGVTIPSRGSAAAVLDVPEFENDRDLERLTRMAAATFSVPMAAIGVIGGDGMRYCAAHGIGPGPFDAVGAFCNHALEAPDGAAMVVRDAAHDPRFADNRPMTGDRIRFYAGAPVVVRGDRIGTICVFDIVPHDVVPTGALRQLSELAAVAGSLFELKDEARVRARTAAELIREEWRHALTLEAGRVGSWVWDLRSGEISANDILRRMFGIDPVKRVMIDDLLAVIREEDRPAFDAALKASFEEGVDFFCEFRVTSGRWLIGRGRVYQRDAAGDPLVMMGVNIDITDGREAAERTRHLLRELNHRVKNTLAMIQSLARQTVRRSPNPQDFIGAFSGRLQTLAEAHVLLSDRDWTGIGLMELIQAQLEPYLVEAGEQLALVGKDLQLPPDHALGLGLILHELCSNAVKHGALRNPNGKVSISWKQVPGNPDRLDLFWIESGGPRVVAPREPGFGSQLIRRSLDKIVDSHVTLEFPPAGVQARIDLPLA